MEITAREPSSLYQPKEARPASLLSALEVALMPVDLQLAHQEWHRQC